MLVDVGFGECFDGPVPLRLGVEHHDTNGVFRLERVDGEWIDLVAAPTALYRFSTSARTIDDFAPGCTFHQSSASHFTKNTICSIRTDTGRVTLRGLDLVRTVDGARRRETIEPRDLAGVLSAEFGIGLPPDELERLRLASRR